MGGLPHQMAGIRKCGEGKRRDQMEFLEAVSVFPGRNYRFFHSASDAGIGGRRVFLHCGIFDDSIHYCQEADVWRPGIGLALSGLHYPDDQRRTVFLYGYTGAVSGQNLYGGEETAYLSGEGEAVVKSLNKFLAGRGLSQFLYIW